jgi:outer membrane protein TolC
MILAALLAWPGSAGMADTAETDRDVAAGMDLSDHPTLDEYLDYALRENAGLTAAYSRWQAALQRVSPAEALPDPRFNYTYFVREVETRVGPQRQKFGLSQTFPWFGKRGLRGDAAAQAAAAEEQRFELEKLHLAFDVKDAYYEYYYLGRAIGITQDDLRLLTYLEEVVRANYKTGKARFSDLVKAQVVIGELEDRLRSLRELRQPFAARLNAVLNRHPDAPVPWPEAVGMRDVRFSEEALYRWLEESHPGLKAMDHMASKEEHLVDLAGKAGWPDFTLGFEWVDTGSARIPDQPDSGKDALGIKVMMNIPLWRDKYRSAGHEAALRREAVLYEKKEAANSLIAALRHAIYQFKDAESKLDLYRDTLIPRAEQSLNVNQKAFAAGDADFLELIDAQRTLLAYRLDYERALADRAISLARIEMQVGRILPAAIPEPAAASGDLRVVHPESSLNLFFKPFHGMTGG